MEFLQRFVADALGCGELCWHSACSAERDSLFDAAGYLREHDAAGGCKQKVRHWLFRRVTHWLGGVLAPGQLDLCEARAQMLFEDLPWCVAFATWRTIGNGWATGRRIRGRDGACRHGCMVLGGDDLRHNFCRPRLREVVMGCRATEPCWIYEGHLQLVVLALPLTRQQTVLSGIWAHINYTVCSHGKRHDRPYTRGGEEVRSRRC